jgi:hypothetical protein
LAYRRIGEICPIEHGKTYYYEFCRDFKAGSAARKLRAGRIG